ncbi:MAG: class I SAM-dependent methyltransferase [Pseudomonadota bacterium]
MGSVLIDTQLPQNAKIIPELDGVPETLLWPLWHRAAEQRRARKLLVDPLAAELVASIDYDFRGHFGRPNPAHVIRARHGDDLIARYLRELPAGETPIVVSLGDGLETQPWRIDEPAIQWFSVDVPEVVTLRKRMLPDHPRLTSVACSALDTAWTDAIPRGSTPFFNAAGLLMYFTDEEAIGLLATIADQFPRAWIYFDTIPTAFSERTLEGFNVTRRYKAPPMPWGIELEDIAPLLASVPGVRAEQVWHYGEPYPSRARVYSLLCKIPAFRRLFGAGLVLARGERKSARGYRG